MTKLSQQECEACKADAPHVTDEELKELMPQIPDWAPVVHDGVLQLEREYQFDNFVDALAFTNKLGALAEQYGHHPAILTEWGKVTVNWWSHKIKGLHKTDLILAAKTDELL